MQCSDHNTANTRFFSQPHPLAYEVIETNSRIEPAYVNWTVVPLELSEKDVQGINIDVAHVPTPVARPSDKWFIDIPVTSTLRSESYLLTCVDLLTTVAIWLDASICSLIVNPWLSLTTMKLSTSISSLKETTTWPKRSKVTSSRND